MRFGSRYPHEISGISLSGILCKFLNPDLKLTHGTSDFFESIPNFQAGRAKNLVQFKIEPFMFRLKVHLLAGARPNFMKLKPVYERFSSASGLEVRIIHTGQHYDYNMSRAFFEDLNMPDPHFYLGMGSANHAVQTARIMMSLDELFDREKPDWLFVFGDVNSTIAGALTAVKRGIRVAHVESGLRSFDMQMPEEVNRILTDRISHLHFVTEPSAIDNLLREGHDSATIKWVGNTMIETLISVLPHAESRFDELSSRFRIEPGGYLLLTLHRPSNVDNRETLSRILETIADYSTDIPVIFPVHPRTKKRLEGIDTGKIVLAEPMRYVDFVSLEMHALGVLTDSGGIQEETTFLNIPCLTLRENTERPITVEIGTNEIIGTEPENIRKYMEKLLSGRWKKRRGIPRFWDDRVSYRILENFLNAL